MNSKASLSFGSLFSGIGGMDLGLENAGFKCAWQVEINDYATKILERRWPRVKRYRDVRECNRSNLQAVDLIAGGFPCQDISAAGKGEGIKGKRSGLWVEFARIISELRPAFVLVENVSALRSRGLSTVLGDLAACGYDAEWECLPASAFGAPHRRDRIFILAYTARELRHRPRIFGEEWRAKLADCGGWPAEPAVGRVVNGFPGRVDQLRCLGNAVVPKIIELVGGVIKQELRE